MSGHVFRILPVTYLGYLVVCSDGGTKGTVLKPTLGFQWHKLLLQVLLLLIGTSLNYFLDNKINKAIILFPGVASILIAVLLGATVHSFSGADNVAKLRSFYENMKDTPEYPATSILRAL